MATITVQRKYIGQGIECYVYDMGDGRVYKDFDRLEFLEHHEKIKYAAVSHELQTIAAEYGLAPAVYELDGIGYYCEKVVCLGDLIGTKDHAQYYALRQQMPALLKKLSEVFDGRMFDNHNGNFGVLSNGRLCLIDFGVIGFSKTKVCRTLREKYEMVRY